MSLALKETIDAMVGRTYLRNGKQLTVERVAQKGEVVKIYTTLETYERHSDQLPKFLEGFLPVDTTPTEAMATQGTVSAPSKLQKMQDALMSALDRVQKDPHYVDQAKEISRLVQTGINLAKLELDAIQLNRD